MAHIVALHNSLATKTVLRTYIVDKNETKNSLKSRTKPFESLIEPPAEDGSNMPTLDG